MTRWQRFKCWIGLHSWGKWESTVIERTPCIGGVGVESLMTEVEGQRRWCDLCGRKQLKEVA